MDIGCQVGPYFIDCRLGRGGMAEVFRVWNASLRRYEAMKSLPRSSQENRSFVERFMLEARTVARLHHPNIASIYSVSDPRDNEFYFTMELVEGPDLATYLADSGPLPLWETVSLLGPVASAIDYAHAEGVVHRDIKPGNILLAGNAIQPVPKVVDFGIARAQEESGGTRLTRSGEILGTPEYMSPEQGGSGEVIGHRTDIYSLGVVAYEMLCGHPPFQRCGSSHGFDVIAQHIKEPPVPPAHLVSSIPAHTSRAIIQALSKHPSDRPASAGAFIAALHQETPDPDGNLSRFRSVVLFVFLFLLIVSLLIGIPALIR